MDRPELRRVTEESARAGAAVALERFRTDLTVERKSGKTDVVTAADRNAQQAVVDRIHRTFPADRIYGEEADTASEIADAGRTWIIDPIDGTNNYVRGNRRWATSVACLVDGSPVAAANVLPAMDDDYVGTADGVTRNETGVSVSAHTDPEQFEVAPLIWWPLDRRGEYAAATEAIVRHFGDLRRPGSAQAALSLLAAGGIEGAITNVAADPWDTVAGAAMVEWAGGTVTDLDGEQWEPDSRGVVASNGTAHDVVLAAANEIEAARE
ncbi:inositol monophosphatase family protein [Halovenus sp. HT40]|uniref:inositol monophosphatase family protein n=1 Tax=Halovenus sp. HT40 TaxID=3126691 RepID=UPI00300F6BCC